MITRLVHALDKAFARCVSRPIDVLRFDLHLDNVDQATLRRAQLAWCVRWNCDPVARFMIHDAVHYLLDAPPTPRGEAMVIAYQFANGLFDDNILGGMTIALTGWLITNRARQHLRAAVRSSARMKERFALLASMKPTQTRELR